MIVTYYWIQIKYENNIPAHQTYTLLTSEATKKCFTLDHILVKIIDTTQINYYLPQNGTIIIENKL